jgi:protein-S-isoprenylcysteine O-methyltransferase Ste14
MKPVVILFLVVYASERILETFWKRRKLSGSILAPYSLPLIVAAYVSFYLLIFREAFVRPEAEFKLELVIVGILSVIISIVGRFWSIKTLGIYHSIHVEIRAQHQLIKSGPYRYVRHPYYLSNGIEAFGLVMLANCGLTVLIVGLIYISLLLHRIIVEEKALENKFGKLFFHYRNHVPLIIPRPRKPGES